MHMQLGGNARARAYFKKHGIAELKAQQKYSSQFAQQFKQTLLAEVNKA